MNIAEQLKLARHQKGFTQQEVAEVLHVTRATISSWEVGRTYPSLDLLVDLSNLYDLSLDRLLKEDISMVEKVSKDVKQKKVYKRIVFGALTVVGLFLTVNIGWLIINKMNYRYLETNWDSGNNFYYLKDKEEGGETEYRTSKMDIQSLARNHYLKKSDIVVSSWVTNPADKSGYGLNMIVAKEQDISMLVEIGETGVSGFIHVNSNMEYIFHEQNSELLQNTVHPEDLQNVRKFLDENREGLKKLYKATKKQYDLVNGR